MNTEQITKIEVGQARIEEKVDGIIQRLDKQNGSIAKLQEVTNGHVIRFAAMNAEKRTWHRIVKPFVHGLVVVLALIIGYALHMSPATISKLLSL